jgi:hypothetical protein
VQIASQLLDLAAWTFGEHADWAHTDHDLAGRMDDAGNLDPTPGGADVTSLTRRYHNSGDQDRRLKAPLRYAKPAGYRSWVGG